MDLWDVVRLMLRRWVVAVPMLLLTFAGTAWVGTTVKPDYTAEGSISLLPPSVEEATVAGKSRTVNPWDTGSLTGAIVVKLRSKAAHDSFAAEGYSSVFEADRDLQYPSVVTVKVTAATEAAATVTARRLLRFVSEEAARQQAQYKLKSGEEITTTVVDDGSNVEPATGKVKRALIVVFGVGAILTVAVTVSVDGLLRWRARRREETQEKLATQALKLPSRVQAANGSNDDTRPVGVSIRYRDSTRTTHPLAKPALAETAGSASSPEATQRIPTQSQLEPIPDDSTIVLPLSNAPWASKKAQPSADGGTEVKRR